MADVTCPSDASTWIDPSNNREFPSNSITCDLPTTTTAITTTTATVTTISDFECGARLMFSGFREENSYLNGIWTLATDNGNHLTSGCLTVQAMGSYRKLKRLNLFSKYNEFPFNI